MRHGDKVKKLGRDRDHRRAMLNNLATSILVKGLAEEQMKRNVKTTLPKAKAVRSLVERLISYAKKGDLSAKRQAARFVKSKEAFKGLFEVLGERYQDRQGGYTRILKLGDFRHGDNAEMAFIGLVEDEVTPKPKKKKGKKKTAAKGTAKSAETKTAESKAAVAEAKPEDKAADSTEKQAGEKAEAKAESKPAEGASKATAPEEAVKTQAKTEAKTEKGEAEEKPEIKAEKPAAKKAKAETKAEPKAKKDASDKASGKDGKKS